jgi:hypothetical protein
MIQCRGRNGWFNLHEAVVFPFLNNTLPPEKGTVAIEISSKKQYRDVSPIYLQGPKDEVEALLRRLLTEVEQCSTSSGLVVRDIEKEVANG